ncbi:alpha/beta fold hydrolase [Kribbella sp. CA-293567]|uniref:alpha/beta fold hydrolase n=1 Tax=Kribbella sp. CA-293567 TaxID=3002436 RepID=UPI0022DE05CF|nr:alpha/beta fold hydrolase [Kribbella sp. CA-293567]WBQ02954.1 alpha/beta fold hydrolase [Kribbella sp. CA-293567]
MPRLPGLVVTDHVFTVPLDHSQPGGPTIEVLAREAVASAKVDADLPWLVYLQGGPGSGAPRPMAASGWIGRATQDYRVLLLDQRGTGRSTPVTARTASKLAPAELAAYLRHFRADSIVRDLELIRAQLSPGKPWTTLGTSYGGFITLTYLSLAPEGLRTCLITGGLPGLDTTADEVYSRTYPRVRGKVEAFYQRYPEDVDRVDRIVDHLRAHDVRLPDGDRLTVRRFQTLGFGLGMGDYAETLHWLLDEAWDGDVLAAKFLYGVMNQTSMGLSPIFVVLHESIYAQDTRPTRWAASRLRPSSFDREASPVLLTGEMIYPWMLDEMALLQPFKEAAELLASATDWTPLYDVARLEANRVPVAAAVWHDDMYVDAGLSLETAARVGNLKTWVTNEWEHDGVRVSGGVVLDRLLTLAADLPQV